MLGAVAKISNTFSRNVMQISRRHGSHGGVPGENLPFDINNKARLTFHFFWYVGTGIGAPFLILFHQLRKD